MGRHSHNLIPRLHVSETIQRCFGKQLNTFYVKRRFCCSRSTTARKVRQRDNARDDLARNVVRNSRRCESLGILDRYQNGSIDGTSHSYRDYQAWRHLAAIKRVISSIVTLPWLKSPLCRPAEVNLLVWCNHLPSHESVKPTKPHCRSQSNHQAVIDDSRAMPSCSRLAWQHHGQH